MAPHVATSGVGQRAMRATSLVDGWIILDPPQEEDVQEVGLDLKVVILKEEGSEGDAYLWWPRLLSVAIVVFLCLLCLRLFYEMCVRCLDRRAQRKRERLLSVDCLSEVSGSRPIARDASAPSHRTSIPREIQDIAGLDKTWQASQLDNMEEALGPAQDRYLAHLEGADTKDWDLGQGEFNET